MYVQLMRILFKFQQEVISRHFTCIFGRPVNFYDIGEMVMPLIEGWLGAWRTVKRWSVMPVSINLDLNVIEALKEVS